MELLPDELILLIVDELDEPKDKRIFSMTCKKYLNITKTIINNIKYAVFSTTGCYECGNTQDLLGIFDNLDYCRKYIKKSLGGREIDWPATKEMNKQNDYTVIGSRHEFCYGAGRYFAGFKIEEIILNNFNL